MRNRVFPRHAIVGLTSLLALAGCVEKGARSTGDAALDGRAPQATDGGQDAGDASASAAACQDLADMTYGTTPLQGVKNYCPAGEVCDETKHCVPMAPCEPGAFEVCSLDAVVAAPTPARRSMFALSGEYLYWTHYGTLGAFDVYQKDGAIRRAKIGEWSTQTVAGSFTAPPIALKVEGDSVYWLLSTGAVYRAPKDGGGAAEFVFKYRHMPNDLDECVFNATHAYCWKYVVRARSENRLLPIRYASGGVEEKFTPSLFSTRARLVKATDDFLYVASTSGHFRVRTSDGRNTRLDEVVDYAELGGCSRCLRALVGDRWLTQESPWLRVRGMDETESHRVAGIGESGPRPWRVWPLAERDSVVFLTYANPKRLVPTFGATTPKVALLEARLDRSEPQQVLSVVPPPGTEEHEVTVGEAGYVIAGKVPKKDEYHVVFHPLGKCMGDTCGSDPPPEGQACSDELPCPSGDVCSAEGVCVAGPDAGPHGPPLWCDEPSVYGLEYDGEEGESCDDTAVCWASTWVYYCDGDDEFGKQYTYSSSRTIVDGHCQITCNDGGMDGGVGGTGGVPRSCLYEPQPCNAVRPAGLPCDPGCDFPADVPVPPITPFDASPDAGAL